MDAMLDLQAGGLMAEVIPEIGGIVSRLVWTGADGRRHDVLYPPSDRAPSTASPNFFGTWAMLPFANRAFDSAVDDGERRFQVAANDPAGTIHGFGWQSAWEVMRYDRGHAVIEHRRSDGPDPYRYRARQEISLDEAGMTIRLSVTNEADMALPFGMGHHPWFPCAADTRLVMRAAGALVFGEAFRATGQEAFVQGGPYADPHPFRSDEVTAWSFLGWDGQARIETPSTGLAVTLTASESLNCPVVWAPAGADFLCVEPQSHAIGAPSESAARIAAPLKRLRPGETLEGWLRIAPEAL
ncbi:putative Aldose 1-epimerase [Hyphomicrobiales bacterium]|nr:putative Aldose 1-epimerase [Hyphomicrobiales bacterium]CAH1697904.1 putative Aldose 1-epimerase [Hyphomicrobiales bacterium]CAI0347550.1 aldose 1-epimerase [Hyphomicrobiales bacterium]